MTSMWYFTLKNTNIFLKLMSKNISFYGFFQSLIRLSDVTFNFLKDLKQTLEKKCLGDTLSTP